MNDIIDRLASSGMSRSEAEALLRQVMQAGVWELLIGVTEGMTAVLSETAGASAMMRAAIAYAKARAFCDEMVAAPKPDA